MQLKPVHIKPTFKTCKDRPHYDNSKSGEWYEENKIALGLFHSLK